MVASSRLVAAAKPSIFTVRFEASFRGRMLVSWIALSHALETDPSVISGIKRLLKIAILIHPDIVGLRDIESHRSTAMHDTRDLPHTTCDCATISEVKVIERWRS